MNEDVIDVHRKVSSPCLRQEAGLTNMTLVNTYQDDTISNGAEINGLRGFEDGTVGCIPWSDQKMCCC
jgi:hypothetical protein